ncbi:hypothetical protein V8E55_011870 [Tylopilus felleus]
MLTEADHRVQAANGGAESACADDTHRLKGWVVKWLMYHTPSPEPRLTPEDKSGRGFHNEMTGQLFHSQNIREYHPAFIVTVDSWPVFLYADGQCDHNNLYKGLFQGEILLMVCPAHENPPSDRWTWSHVAMLAGMKTIEPRAIAYVACQLQFALSSVNSWAIRDGVFDYREFYTVIVEWFERASTTEAKKTVEELLL